MKKALSVLLVSLLLLPVLTTALTVSADEAAPGAEPQGYEKFENADGSETRLYDDGSVSTVYKDGSFEGVDADGNRHTQDADGTYTVYAPDGSIAVERPDGTRELTESDGKKQVFHPDGSGSVTYSSGLTFDYDSDYNYTAAYFADGKQRLEADKNGEFPTGEIKGKHGEKLVNSEDGLYLKGADGTEYTMSESNNSATIVFADGGSVKVENGNGEITFPDGSRFTADKDGMGRFVSADGSYLYKDTESDAWEMYNAEDDSYVRVNENGELTDMHLTSDGNVIDIRDGRIREWVDSEAGVTIRTDENGTTFETPEGTYFTDGQGNVYKDGQLLTQETSAASGEEHIGRDPQEGEFVPVSEVFDLENYEGELPEDYRRVDGMTLSFEYLFSVTYGMDYSHAYYGIDAVFGGGIEVTHTVSDKPSLTLIEGGHVDDFTLTGTYDYREPVSGNGVRLPDGRWITHYNYRSDLSITVANLSLEDGIVSADVSAHLNGAVGSNDEFEDSISEDYPVTHVEGTHRVSRKAGVTFVTLTLPREISSSGTSEIGIAFCIERVLPAAGQVTDAPGTGEETEPTPAEPDGYVKYNGHLTYRNGETNKYGQPWPDLMDFDCDGDIDYADRAIQHVLVHNPDALETPEGAALVATAVLVAILGTGGGITAAAAAAAAGAGGAGLDLHFEFADDETDDETDDDTPEDLGPYVQRDADGDLTVTDPATGEERLYRANGDGTYTNPLTGATYTAAELKSSLDSRADNADLIRQDEAARRDAVESQREDNAGKSWVAEEYEKQQADEREREAREEAHDAYVEKLMDEHGRYTEEGLRETIAEKKDQAEIEGYEQREYEKEYEKSQKYTENVKAGADVAIDVLAEIEPTGAGKAIKDGYAVASSAASNAGDVMAGYKTVGGAIVQTAVDSGVELLKNHSDGVTEKYASNVMGDSVKAMSDTYMKGGSTEDIRQAGQSAAIQGGINATVDVAFDAAGDKAAKAVGLTGDKVVGTVGGQAVTKGAVGDGAGTMANDLAKMALTPEDADEAKQRAFREDREKAEQAANAEAAEHFRQSQREWAERRNEEAHKE